MSDQAHQVLVHRLATVIAHNLDRSKSTLPLSIELAEAVIAELGLDVEKQEPFLPGSESLRTRIAAAIEHGISDTGPGSFDAVADTVIKELGLRPEWGALDGNNEGVLADTPGELTPLSGEKLKRRYITDWTLEEEEKSGKSYCNRCGIPAPDKHPCGRDQG